MHEILFQYDSEDNITAKSRIPLPNKLKSL